MFVEVRDRDEPNQPGSQYVRQKKAGIWSGWQKAEGTAMGGTPPLAPANGMFWWDPTRGKLFVFYSDPDTSQWVEAVATPDMNPDDFVRIDVPQTLTEGEKAQARKNIYAAPFNDQHLHLRWLAAVQIRDDGDQRAGRQSGCRCGNFKFCEPALCAGCDRASITWQ
jgi:hypothetical protein